MYVTDQINSSESEGAFNEFVEEQLENLVDAILTEGDLENFGERGSDILVEMDDIVAPTFVYGDEGEGGGVVVEGGQVAAEGKSDSMSLFNI